MTATPALAEALAADLAAGPPARARLAQCLQRADPQCGTAAIEGERAAVEATALAAELGDTVARGRAGGWRCAHLLRLGRHAELQALAVDLLAGMEAPALADDRFELMRLLTLSAAESGAFELALDTAHRMVRDAREEVPADSLNAAYALAVCLERAGDPWQALRVAEQALAPGTPGGAAPDAASMILENAICAMSIGLFHRLNGVAETHELHALLTRARGAGERALARQARLRYAFYSVATAGNLGEVLTHLGELQPAATLLARALDAAIAQGAASHEWRVRTSMADWLLAEGRAAEAAEALDQLLAAMGPAPPAQTAIRAHHAAYRAQRALGFHARALAHLEQAERLERRALMSQLRCRSAHFVTRAEAQRAESKAERDPLTGLGNRRYTDRRWAELTADAGAHLLAVAHLDVDHFKRINDRHGHAVGDRVLVVLADLLRRHVRAGDAVARHGGEEFVLLLPGLDGEAAAEACERLRERIAAHAWAAEFEGFAATAEDQVRVSIGVAAAAAPRDLAALLARADEALYRAKREGRNRVRRG
jgi:diguanylate cyclase (GGDEF)-like protein